MFLVDIEQREKYAKFFEACEDACILSAVSGMNGEMYVDSLNNPTVYAINVSDYSFITGDASGKEAVKALKFLDSIHDEDYSIRAVNKDFESVIKDLYKDRAAVRKRFATKRSFAKMDFEAFDKAMAKTKEEYELRLMDEEIFNKCKSEEWMKDFTVSYETYADFCAGGLGVFWLKDNEPVAGASSYSAYPGGIEIEIITREDYRCKGLAYASGAALISECRRRNLVASWDAAHEGSLRLALRLGYEFLYEYELYKIQKPQA